VDNDLLPEHEQVVREELAADNMDVGYLEEGFDKVVDMLNIFCNRWREAWQPGPSLVIDETMISWQGASSGRLMYVQRKPSPFGIMCDTMVCGTTGILLNANIAEGKYIEPLKEFYAEYGAHTALCMRLVRPYAMSGRYVIGDARFGSYTCAYNLKQCMGIYSILNVKGNTKYSCKDKIKS
jgi:hypothetical protein